MEFNNSVYPTKEQMDGFLEGDDNSPISMVNLLKFKDKAEYKDGRETNLTGAEAYAIYSKEVVKHLKKVGAEWVYSGDVTRLMLGNIEELWDMVAIRDSVVQVEHRKIKWHRCVRCYSANGRIIRRD